MIRKCVFFENVLNYVEVNSERCFLVFYFLEVVVRCIFF